MISPVNPEYGKTPVNCLKNFNYTFHSDKVIPEVSIITPFYNTGEIFLETVDCVLNQSFQNFEWIIINDCSKDARSIEILSGLATKDPRIKILNNKENLGPGACRNVGITISKGNFLFFVDSDDLIEQTIIEKYWLFLKINNQYSFCNAWHVGFGAENYIWKKGFDHGKAMLYENVIQPTFLAKRSLFDSVKFDESIKDGFEDWDFWLRCAVNGHWGFTIPEILYWYRRTPNTVNKWKNWDMGEKMEKFKAKLVEKYYEPIKNNFPEPQLSSFLRGLDVGKPVFDNLHVNPLPKSNKKRLLFIVPWMAMGGADKFNLDLIQGLIKSNNWEVTIITTQQSDNAWYTEFAKYTSDIFVLHNYTKEFFYVQILEYLINSRTPDSILISNSEIGYYLTPYIKSNFPGIALFDYNHMEESYWNNGGHPRQSVIYQSIFDKNIVSSEHLKQWMANEGAKKEKIEVVYTSSDFKTIKKSDSVRTELREKWGVDDDFCVIVFSGRLTHQKQPYLLLDSIKEVSKKHKNGFALAIAGDGPDMESLKKWVSSNNLNNKIWFLGALSNEDNLKVLQAGDIFYLPSLWEGISLAIYEAMTLELPIVCANVGGQKELVTPENGFLVARSDPATETKKYADILLQLIQDPARRKALGQKSRQIIEKKFGIERMWAKMDQVLSTTPPVYTQLELNAMNQLLRQTYALLFFERKLADELWHNGYLQLNGNKSNNGKQQLPNDPSSYFWHYSNYEILPRWYKQVAHVIKILNGKRNWKSIYSPKYRPDPAKFTHSEWYAIEYDVLPGWYKKFGHFLKKYKITANRN